MTDQEHNNSTANDPFGDWLEEMVEGPKPTPRRITIYGGPKIGKTTFASSAPSPAIIQTEDGSNDIAIPGVRRFPVRTNFADVWRDCERIAYGNHPFKTAVLDSADWCERLLTDEIARAAHKPTISDIAYGKGWDAAEQAFRKLLALFDAMQARGMHVVIIAHADLAKINDPEVDPYDKWIPRLSKRLWPILVEWSTEILFATRKIYTTKEDAGFGKKTVRATGGDDRIIRTVERPGVCAGNRLGLPEELPLDWKAFAEYLPPI